LVLTLLLLHHFATARLYILDALPESHGEDEIGQRLSENLAETTVTIEGCIFGALTRCNRSRSGTKVIRFVRNSPF
jgi:hypothetical protein